MEQELQHQQANGLFHQARQALSRAKYQQNYTARAYKRIKRLEKIEAKYKRILQWRRMVQLDNYEMKAFDEIIKG